MVDDINIVLGYMSMFDSIPISLVSNKNGRVKN